MTWEGAPDLVDTDDELTEGDLDGVGRVALGDIRATGIDIEVKTRDEDGDAWYVRRGGQPAATDTRAGVGAGDTRRRHAGGHLTPETETDQNIRSRHDADVRNRGIEPSKR